MASENIWAVAAQESPGATISKLQIERWAKESDEASDPRFACATAGLRRRFAARVWRDYYKHVDARRRYANPTDEGLAAQQRDRQIEEESRRRENEERVAQYNYFAARASNRSAWARAGMG